MRLRFSYPQASENKIGTLRFLQCLIFPLVLSLPMAGTAFNCIMSDETLKNPCLCKPRYQMEHDLQSASGSELIIGKVTLALSYPPVEIVVALAMLLVFYWAARAKAPPKESGQWAAFFWLWNRKISWWKAAMIIVPVSILYICIALIVTLSGGSLTCWD